MTDDNKPSNVPPLEDVPEFLQGDDWFHSDTSQYYLDFAKPYTPPKWTLSHGGIPFAKLGDLHVIQGKSGQGKTNLMTQFMATILKGECGKLRYELKEVPNPSVLYIDTEMSEDDTIAVKNRTCSLAGLDLNQTQERFRILRLRDVIDVVERWRLILKAIWELKPTVAFLDGMLDIVNDYNSQTECQPLIRKCMHLVTHYNMSLWCILHENPTAEKMVGTLGSMLQRKVTESFTVIKHKNDSKFPTFPKIFFEVQQPKSRGQDQDDWYFEMKNTEPWGRPSELDGNGQAESLEDREARELIQECDDRFKAYNWRPMGATYTELEVYLHSQGITSNRRKKKLFDTAIEKSIIYKDAKKKYHYNELKELPNDEVKPIPFEAPTEGESDAPF